MLPLIHNDETLSKMAHEYVGQSIEQPLKRGDLIFLEPVEKYAAINIMLYVKNGFPLYTRDDCLASDEWPSINKPVLFLGYNVFNKVWASKGQIGNIKKRFLKNITHNNIQYDLCQTVDWESVIYVTFLHSKSIIVQPCYVANFSTIASPMQIVCKNFFSSWKKA